MKLVITDNYEQLSQQAANLVVDALKKKADLVLGLATGSTPEGLYAALSRLHRERALDFSAVTTFNLDEYLDLPGDHPQSYRYFMERHLFSQVNINSSQINIPSGCSADPVSECLEYDRRIKAKGGIDLQILGIGVNGHIGFNEPARQLKVGTHLVKLSAETIEANSRFFSSTDEVPRRAITMGLGSIMQARQVVLLASGITKAEAIRDTVSGLVSTAVPASLLQLHRNVTVLVDRAAAALVDKPADI